MIDSPLGGDEEPDLQGLAGAEPDIPAPAGTGAPLGDDDRVLLVFSYLGPLSLVAFAAARRAPSLISVTSRRVSSWRWPWRRR